MFGHHESKNCAAPAWGTDPLPKDRHRDLLAMTQPSEDHWRDGWTKVGDGPRANPRIEVMDGSDPRGSRGLALLCALKQGGRDAAAGRVTEPP